MFSLKKTIIGAVAALGMMAGSAANAGPVTNILYLSIDESGSIGSTNFTTQMNAYEAALAAVVPLDGSLAIGVGTFSNGVFHEIDIAQINTQADLDALVAAVDSILYNGGSTWIGSALQDAAGRISAYASTNSLACGTINCVIDISTDGSSYQDPVTIATGVGAATAGSITVNCLGIGGSADCSFSTGFSVVDVGFDELEAALKAKIRRETGQAPAPAALLLIGFGLAGLGFARRKAA